MRQIRRTIVVPHRGVYVCARTTTLGDIYSARIEDMCWAGHSFASSANWNRHPGTRIFAGVFGVAPVPAPVHQSEQILLFHVKTGATHTGAMTQEHPLLSDEADASPPPP